MDNPNYNLNHLVTDKDLIEVLVSENSRLTLENAELVVVINKLIEFIDKMDTSGKISEEFLNSFSRENPSNNESETVKSKKHNGV